MNFIVLDFIFLKLFELSIAALVIMLVILLLKQIGKRIFTSKLLYFLWIIFIFKLIFPISIPSFTSVENITDRYLFMEEHSPTSIAINTLSKVVQSHNYENEIKKENRVYRNGKLINYTSIIKDPTAVKAYKYASARNKILDVMGILWLVGFGILISLKVYNNMKFKKYFVKNNYCMDEQIIKIYINCKKQMGIKKDIKLIVSGSVVPMMCGLFKPCIILPYDCTKVFTLDEIRLILMHELAHYKQKDVVLYFMSDILSAIYWFNPLICFGLREMKDNLELLSDDNVLRRIGCKESINYGRVLMKQAEVNVGKFSSSISAGLLKKTSKLSARIKNILNYKKTVSNKFKYVIGTIIILFMFLTMLPVNNLYAMQQKYIKQKPILYAFWINSNVNIKNLKNIDTISSQMVGAKSDEKNIILIKKDENIKDVIQKKVNLLFFNEPIKINIKGIRNEIHNKNINNGKLYIFYMYNFANTKTSSMSIEKSTIIDMKSLNKLDEINLY